ncbi:hypothetical protein CW706_06135 [Candidatus Bathyarchaeota archaeon]|nr:MAG: hypothetical protein CW706_06135 [Candidatus Bathyarchaeota archaeon]
MSSLKIELLKPVVMKGFYIFHLLSSSISTYIENLESSAAPKPIEAISTIFFLIDIASQRGFSELIPS